MDVKIITKDQIIILTNISWFGVENGMLMCYDSDSVIAAFCDWESCIGIKYIKG